MSYKALKAKLLSSWVGKSEKAKVDFAFQITDLMKSKSINKKQLAEQLGSSPSYITKVLRGDQNLSIESIYKIADALSADVHLKMVDKESESLHTLNAKTGQWIECISSYKKENITNKYDYRNKGYAIDLHNISGEGRRTYA